MLAEAASIMDNAPTDVNDAPLAINQTTANNVPNNAPNHAPNAPNHAPSPMHNVPAAPACNNVSASKNATAPALNNLLGPAVNAVNNVLATPNAAAVDSAACLDAPVLAVDAVVPLAPSNAHPTLNDAPTNVVVKIEPMESDEVLIVANKKFMECVKYVLDHTDDKDEDDHKITFVPIMCKIKVEPGMQGTSLEAPAPSGASDIGSVPTASALAPCAAVCPTVHPTRTIHAIVPPCCCTCCCLPSGWGGRRREQ